ncbi:unnamed protein product [Clonostachys chloroleuca]|uniref:Glucose-methanol-choline oxidoreductase N-terminal domain-containing protein n=1 Tax=Clonostachys chloroleuca TaxID=1926264 RepID=A0AA35PYI2_9HYPO|nr:unnamed protein product [Clonostachys chloroleuca]
MAPPYDYIIVGGGTAGLTVAARLTEDPAISVLVLEAGDNHRDDPLINTPGLMAGTYGNPKYDWGFRSVPQKELNNRIIAQPRGKGLGGSSAINFLMLVHPSRKSLDSWEELGNEGWGFDSMEPYLHKFATVYDPPQAAKETVGLSYHDTDVGSEGPVSVSYSEGYSTTNKAWMESFKKFGLEMTGSIRAGGTLGAFQQPATIDPETKTRSYALTAYHTHEIASRKNLTVMTNTVVKKLLLDTSGVEPVAQGVITVPSSGSGPETVINGSEVILATGSLMSPQILELSGIGDRSLLESHGIPVIVHNPSVGENLQDHPITCQSFEVNPGTTSSDVLRDPAILQALLQKYTTSNGAGPLGQSNISIALMPPTDASGVTSSQVRKDLFDSNAEHLKSDDSKVLRAILESGDEATAEYLLFPGQVNTVLSEPSSMAEYLLPARPENYLTIMTLLNHPFSRGSVHIKSSDIHDLPVWDPNFGSNPFDAELSARHIQFVETLIKSETFSALLKVDGSRIPSLKADTVEDAKEIIRQSQVSDFHPAGSCGMRPKEKGGVVDSELRVYGVKGVRIVDASIFPLEPAGNIQSLVYAVAERAADLIKRGRLKTYKERGEFVGIKEGGECSNIPERAECLNIEESTECLNIKFSIVV